MTATFLISLGYTAEADRLTVVDDVRFLNEAEAVRRHGGIMVRVVRPGFDADAQHRSEGGLDAYEGFDHVIYNDGSLEELRHTVDDVLGQK